MNDNLDPRIHITLEDLEHCMNQIDKKMDTIKDGIVKVPHPAQKIHKNAVPIFIEFEVDSVEKNIKLSSDLAIVWKY